jgi:hypothetical protein
MPEININSDRQQVHLLLNSLPDEKVSAVRNLLEEMLDPVTRVIANAPYEDEPISEEENRAVAASKEWLKEHEPISNEEVLAEFGLTAEDFERMGRTPLESEPHHPGQ